uniref:Nuclear nucleic acid-binding protein C1D n=1 Tax=Glossina morsitans morsitans TaxID=37546 RepID=A0A1B0FAE3_GLOMM
MSISRDYCELDNDKKLIKIIENFDKSLDKIEKSLLAAVQFENYEHLTTEDKVKFDNYVVYCTNSLFWMHVKLLGEDPNEHAIKAELARVRQTILRDKEIYEHKTIRPVVDKSAAARFIKHGLQIYDRPAADTQEDSKMEE